MFLHFTARLKCCNTLIANINPSIITVPDFLVLCLVIFWLQGICTVQEYKHATALVENLVKILNDLGRS